MGRFGGTRSPKTARVTVAAAPAATVLGAARAAPASARVPDAGAGERPPCGRAGRSLA
ncbi:hypothetical protein ABT340_05170 [Streptosporangium sp. NPDC000239]|uniref:hypothetical protein n=1 Tax=Streptosporangium sp. NPDC000239 TaxID=3154248 RepID=UPI0033303BA0